ncbi:MAG: ATP-dependent helicase [Lentisphaeraceae bacterium]|nr:ATP-dependent helicase [Lentisphaeraceae bacterium]
MKKVAPDHWIPADGLTLELASENAVRSDINSLVIAGPGAGKTELLAQRASYLLETGLCTRSKRILAISFKRDSARNLQERVKKRCGEELARRFNSLTFDSFAKNLLDRFRESLPDQWKPSADYEIDFTISNRRNWNVLLDQLEGRSGIQRNEIEHNLRDQLFKNKTLTKLPYQAFEQNTLEYKASKEIWNILLHEREALNFQMVGCLSLFILQSNPYLLKALRMTYSHVFLDEFQDTTGLQYELTKVCFKGSAAILTSVGDPKQRIMKWAGALEGIFGHFQRDFDAKVFRPICNYRSAPELVRIQNVLSRAIEGEDTPKVESRRDTEVDGECRSFAFSTHNQEASIIASNIQEWMSEDELEPRDICILSRQTPEQYAVELQSELAKLGIKSRIETELQDLLSEPVINILITSLKLIVNGKDPDSWKSVTDELINFYGSPEDDREIRKIEDDLSRFLKEKRENLVDPTSQEEVNGHLGLILDYFDRSALVNFYPQYKRGKFLDDILSKTARFLFEYYKGNHSWEQTLIEFEGKNSIPIMTMHKSKGLEYHTVIFLGLEDGALWGYTNNPDEETCGFFVALSRAKQRVIFTFSKIRDGVGRHSQQNASNILPLYDLLKEAGIKPELFNN